MADNTLVPRRLGIDTYQEPVAYLRQDSAVCRAEGFNAQSRVRVHCGDRSVIATLNTIHSDLLAATEAGLSEAAWRLLQPQPGESLRFSHPRPVESMSDVRGKLYGRVLDNAAARRIIGDIHEGRYSDIELAAYVTACAGKRLVLEEVIALTRAMVDSGKRLSWDRPLVMDKHCVGGLPGNRTTPIVVPIVVSAGLLMPKTSSRAITSPAGTADTMETLAPVALDIEQMRRVIEQQGGCIVWGGSVSLSPVDDTIIRVERALDLDSEGQLVASVISKKAAAGSTRVLVDMPVGPTAKVRNAEMAQRLERFLLATGRAMGLQVRVHISDGVQPVGRGIGPALEARDILAVLQNRDGAPADLRGRALTLAGAILELGDKAAPGRGLALATELLDSGRAWEKFQAICEAQGGMREPPVARYQHTVTATHHGLVAHMNTRCIAKLAKLAGAPNDPAAGIYLQVRLGDRVEPGAPLFTLHADSAGALHYALDFLDNHPETLSVEGERI
jgi:thymidine phosphorylase